VSEAIFRKDDLPAATAVGSQWAVLLLYGATLFLSATLLFAIQPMFAKIALPLLGGSPGVWNTAMVFFQATLLLAYGYAHLGTRLGGARRQVPVHVPVLALGFLALPVAGMAWTPPTEGTPVFWLIAFLAASIGLPVFAISATAPLLQRWFAATDHPSAKDPYFLYGASNLGSVIALLGYPALLERLLTLKQQAQLWSAGYVLLVVLIGGCALALWWRPALSAMRAASDVSAAPLTWRQRGLWVLLAFVPSSLMLGVTAHISTDIAATPLFWVVPLTLYLLTFVVVFARRPLLRHAWMLRLQPFLLIPLALTFNYLPGVFWLGLALHLLVFFVTAMVCHGELSRRRPAALHLTEFYVWMSVGGVLGGMFNGLLAPIVFNGVYEYPLVLALACLLRPRQEGAAVFSWRDLLIPIALLAVLSLPMMAPARFGVPGIVIFYVTLGCLLLYTADRPLRFALTFAVVIFGASGASHQFLEQERSFFGVNRIQLDDSKEFLLLVHGNTVHGAEHRDPARRDEPLTYYSKEGSVGQLFSILEARGGIDHVGLTGLGIGTTLCYRQPGQHWTIYEIDPIVVRFARDTRYFHYLEDCAGDTPIQLGDARISLAKAQRGQFDLLVFDAFSSDSVPVHLVTREALALYLDKLAEHGVIAFHISNRHIDLQPVLANLAADAGLVAWAQAHRTTAAMREQDYKVDSQWVVMARRPEDVGALPSDSRWRRLEPHPGLHLWTDDYSNILGAMR
jgi:hypothetical protein